jgi:hypothetical protein
MTMLRIIALGLTLTAAAFALPAGASTRVASPEPLVIGAPASREPIPADFLGLSFEYWATLA